MSVAAIILTLNEVLRIEECLKHLRPHIDYILVVDGGSKDRTVEIAKRYADAVEVRPRAKNFAKEKNWAEENLPLGCEWILHCDTDERFPEEFLKDIKSIVSQIKEDSVRFPRLNLPDRKLYPDYQVRLLRRGKAIWKHRIHEIPYSPSENKPIDQVNCKTLNQFHIIHLERRKDLKREWW